MSNHNKSRVWVSIPYSMYDKRHEYDSLRAGVVDYLDAQGINNGSSKLGAIGYSNTYEMAYTDYYEAHILRLKDNYRLHVCLVEEHHLGGINEDLYCMNLYEGWDLTAGLFKETALANKFKVPTLFIEMESLEEYIYNVTDVSRVNAFIQTEFDDRPMLFHERAHHIEGAFANVKKMGLKMPLRVAQERLDGVEPKEFKQSEEPPFSSMMTGNHLDTVSIPTDNWNKDRWLSYIQKAGMVLMPKNLTNKRRRTITRGK